MKIRFGKGLDEKVFSAEGSQDSERQDFPFECSVLALSGSAPRWAHPHQRDLAEQPGRPERKVGSPGKETAKQTWPLLSDAP